MNIPCLDWESPLSSLLLTSCPKEGDSLFSHLHLCRSCSQSGNGSFRSSVELPSHLTSSPCLHHLSAPAPTSSFSFKVTKASSWTQIDTPFPLMNLDMPNKSALGSFSCNEEDPSKLTFCPAWANTYSTSFGLATGW